MTEIKQPEIGDGALAAYIPETPVITKALQEDTDG